MAYGRRLRNLLHGVFGQWLRRREHRNPGAVYETAIQERLAEYARLRSATAGILFLRTKLAAELEGTSTELKRLAAQLELAVQQDDDAVALALLERRDVLGREVERLTLELKELEGEAAAAKANLGTFHAEITRLREEKTRMLARLANARARLRLHETLSGLSTTADMQALESVREHINRLLTEVELTREMGDQQLEKRLGAIRAAEASAAARKQLDELKRARRSEAAPAA